MKQLNEKKEILKEKANLLNSDFYINNYLRQIFDKQTNFGYENFDDDVIINTKGLMVTEKDKKARKDYITYKRPTNDLI